MRQASRRFVTEISRSPLLVLLLAMMATAQAEAGQGSSGRAQRPAHRILRDFDGVDMPSFSGGNSPEAVRRFREAINEGCERKGKLALELYRSWPDHERVPELLLTRWAGMNNALGRSKAVLREVRDVLDQEKRKAIRAEAFAAAARAALLIPTVKRSAKVKLIEAMIKTMPEDDRCPVSLLDLAKYHTSDAGEMATLCERILETWPESRWAANPARALKKRLDRIGEPFTRVFEDVLSGEEHDTSEWKGSLVLFHVWSGRSEAIDREMDSVRAFGQRHPRIKLVGVHCWRIDGDVPALRQRLAAMELAWPHVYPVDEMKTPGSGSWAVGEVPCYFLVDKKGRLAAFGFRIANIELAVARLLKGRKSLTP